jgi:hypothetical protein
MENYMAGQVQAVITKPGRYNPRQWSTITTHMIVTGSPSAPVEVMVEVARLQTQIDKLLLETIFTRANGGMSEEAVQFLADQAMNKIVVLAGPTKWARNFSNEIIRAMIFDAIARNLRSVVNILRGQT